MSWTRPLLLLGLVLAGCAGDGERRQDVATRIADDAELTPVTLSAGRFTLAGFVRMADRARPVTIYIEGDGLAWLSRAQPSADPTPRDPIGLRLAALDDGPNVIYLARPCQYIRTAACDPAYWTGKRFAEEVVAGTSTAIDRLVSPGEKIHLVGYSGGGGIAVLLAARRGDVLSLRTLAGNLDHATLSRVHDVSPMSGSLNPLDVADRLVSLPQTHYAGSDDRVVPPAVAESFLRALGGSRCATLIELRDVEHGEDWVRVWRSVHAQLPSCR